jgi:hypothetical protein
MIPIPEPLGEKNGLTLESSSTHIMTRCSGRKSLHDGRTLWMSAPLFLPLLPHLLRVCMALEPRRHVRRSTGWLPPPSVERSPLHVGFGMRVRPPWTCDERRATASETTESSFDERQRPASVDSTLSGRLGCFPCVRFCMRSLISCCRALRQASEASGDHEDCKATIEELSRSSSLEASPAISVVIERPSSPRMALPAREDLRQDPTAVPREPKHRDEADRAGRDTLSLPSSPISARSAWRAAQNAMSGRTRGSTPRASAVEHEAETLRQVVRRDGDDTSATEARPQILPTRMNAGDTQVETAPDAALERWCRVLAIRNAGRQCSRLIPEHRMIRPNALIHPHAAMSEQATRTAQEEPGH